MADARGRRITITIEGDGASFQVSGKTIDFPGYLRAYVEGSDDPEAELADQETVLPAVAVGEALDCSELEPKSHTTQPPARFSEATLTRALEEMGIGRPSTYASIIDTILARDYVFKKGNALVPTWMAFAVVAVAGGAPARTWSTINSRPRWKTTSTRSAAASRAPGLPAQLLLRQRHAGAQAAAGAQGRRNRRPRHQPHSHRQARREDETIVVRVGPLWAVPRAGRAASALPEGTAARRGDDRRRPWSCSTRPQQAEEPLGHCPETGKPVYLKVGRFGPYVQRGTTGRRREAARTPRCSRA